ncbi:ABC transporter transmembrane domain-containing protein [Mangrovicoccus ximenensis]|uniref:ABC transporter transmembrane domain-containing protein n=1 Tax=Mangrovicoccus ximenensis TaxID=1911570 RepID=UPI000D3413C3|nr:ABC transporter transmembrane domain-containing protein [Mangrovicoccus ximenensis]
MIRQHTKRASARVIAVATCCIVLLELVVPLTVLQTYDRFIPNGSAASLAVLLSVAAVCLVAEYMLRQSRSVLLNLRGSSFAHQAGCHVMDELLRGDMALAGGQRTGENLALLNTVRGMREMTSGQWLSSLAELLLVPLSLGLIALIAGPLVLVPLVLIGLFAGFSWMAGKGLAADRARRQDTDAHRMNAMVEMFQGLPTIKALSVEQIMRRRYEAAKYGSSLAHMSVMRRMTALFDATTSFGTLLVMSLIMAGAFLTVTGQITAGAMIASVILSGRTMAPIQKGLSLINRRQEFLIEKRHVDALLETGKSAAAGLPLLEPANEGRLALRGAALSRPWRRSWAATCRRRSRRWPEIWKPKPASRPNWRPLWSPSRRIWRATAASSRRASTTTSTRRAG